MNDTLVLNKSYIPNSIITWQNTMKLLCKEHARAIDEDYMVYSFEDWIKQSYKFEDMKKIRTVNYTISVPHVIVLTQYNSLPVREVKYTRQTIFQRDNCTCQYCGKKFKMSELEKEHVIPKSQGGKNTWDNIVAACTPCNKKKENRTPEQAGMKLISKPRTPDWLNPYNALKSHPHKKEQWKVFLEKV